MAIYVIAGFCSCIPAQNENEVENTIWAALDGKKSLLFYSPPSTDWISSYSTGTTHIDGMGLFHIRYYAASWTTVQESQVTDQRETITFVITKMMSKTFPPHLFHNFYRIQHFQMTHQGLTQLFKDNFENAQFVRNMNLSHNSIERLPERLFEETPQLVEIDLSFNKIKFIEAGVFKSNILQRIYLQNNEIVEWDYNRFMDISESSVQKKGLEYLNIANNNLTDLGFPYPMKSRQIDASNTSLSNIIITVEVISLNASQNSISEILPKVIADEDTIFELQHLNLSRNVLTSLADLTHFNKLLTLDLSHNLIESFDNDIFSKMNTLKELRLGNNLLKDMDFGFLPHIHQLIYLDISYNELAGFHLLKIAPNLEELHIEGNNLTELDTNMKRMAPHLVKLGIDNNHWDCEHLTTSLLLLQFDGIAPVVDASGAGDLPNTINYDGNIKGVGCFKNNDKAVAVPNTLTNEILVRDHDKKLFAYVDGQIESMKTDIFETVAATISDELSGLENRLVEAMSTRFDKIKVRLNTMDERMGYPTADPNDYESD